MDSSSELCIDDSLNPTTIAVPDPESATEPAGDVKADGETGGEDESEVLHNPPSSVTPATPSRVTEDGERPLLSQVVLPLPGYEVIFPDNESGLPSSVRVCFYAGLDLWVGLNYNPAPLDSVISFVSLLK